MARLPKALGLLLVAGAGVSTFYVAAQLARNSRDVQNGIAEAVIQPAARPPAPSTATVTLMASNAAESELTVKLSERSRSIPKSTTDLFTSSSWLPPPPPPPSPPPLSLAPPPPAAPVAPPLPFVFVGMLERGTAKPEAFIAKGDALFVVSVGDTIDTSYRIDSLTADAVVMTYLPLNTRQTLNTNTGSK